MPWATNWRISGHHATPAPALTPHQHVKDDWWWYRKYAPGDMELERFEMEAREAKKGLWADPEPVPPWEWKKR